MVNATEMAKAFNKRLDNFTRLKQTKEFIKVLESVPSDVREREIIKVIKGGVPELQGTWYCDTLALKLAAWLEPRFEVWIYTKIKELLTTGKTELSPYPITNKELSFYLQKIADNSLEASRLAEQLIEKKKGLYLPPEE